MERTFFIFFTNTAKNFIFSYYYAFTSSTASFFKAISKLPKLHSHEHKPIRKVRRSYISMISSTIFRLAEISERKLCFYDIIDYFPFSGNWMQELDEDTRRET